MLRVSAREKRRVFNHGKDGKDGREKDGREKEGKEKDKRIIACYKNFKQN